MLVDMEFINIISDFCVDVESFNQFVISSAKKSISSDAKNLSTGKQNYPLLFELNYRGCECRHSLSMKFS